MTLRALVAAVAFAAALTTITGSALAAAWAPTVQIYQGVKTYPAGVAIAPDGTVITAVSHGSVGKSDHHVEVRSKPPGGTFGPPQTLTTVAESGVRMVSDAEGNLAVVWTQMVGGVRALRGTTRPAGGSFGPVRIISDAASDTNDWDLAIAGGHVVVSWQQSQRVRVATATVGGTFEPHDPLTGPLSIERSPQAAVAPNGAAVVVWAVRPIGPTERIQAAARPPGGSFAPLPEVAQFADSHDMINYEVSISDEGRATAAWSYLDKTTNRWVMQSASRGKTGSFGGIETVDTSGVDSDGEFGLKTAADGTSLLMWLDVLAFPNSMEQKVRYAIRPDGGGFGPTLTVMEGVGTSAPLIAFGPDDTAVAVWDSVYVGRSSVQTARVPLDGTIARAEQIGVPTLQPGIIEIFMGSGLDADAAGNAALAWTRGTDTDPGPAINYKLAHEIRIFDANPPTIADVQVPETVLTDVPVGMSVTATDLTPIKIRWTVNKFTTLLGPQIAPTYTTPGLHKVGIEVTDAVGHTTFASRAVQVTQNPAPPPSEPPCPPGQICQ